MMKDILITSSALILALLLIRRVFRGALSRRFQYALWGLVLVRLLVPVSLLPAADFSVLSAARPVEQAVAERVNLNRVLYFRPQGQVSQAELEERNIDPERISTTRGEGLTVETKGPNQPWDSYLVRDPETGAVTWYAEATVGPWRILDKVWKAGMILMGGFFLLSNLGFYLRLRKNRKEWRAQWLRPTISATPQSGGTQPLVGPDDPTGHFSRKIYVVPQEVIPSPCLFGRSIYITPAVAADESKLRHVLCHEATHAKHGDPVWALLRCVCLTVYWFDPLVWIAARCARIDCELACDEGALAVLGEGERIPYGQTLVSLIPVKRGSNPLIAATTMTAGKKQLADRVKRIAQRPRQFWAAALAVAMLAGIVSACTFTGGKESPAPSPSQGPSEDTIRALSGEELRWFNEEFFNHFSSPASYSYNIRNQFASPINLYERPEDINLYELFYLEGRTPTPKELRAYGVEEESDLVCPVYVITAGEMEALLEEYTGLSLEEVDLEGLGYEYVEAVDAYFNMHGDTNYCGYLDFTAGTREGDRVKLYHRSDFAGGGWYCVTLEEGRDDPARPTEEGEESPYWFVSNVACDRPLIPTPLPAWEPEKTVSLAGLEPYAPPAVTVETHVGDFDNSYENRLENWDFEGRNVVVYRATDGKIYAAVRREEGVMDVFFPLSDDDFSLFPYSDLLGHNGFTLTYRPEADAQRYPTDSDYYYFDEAGTPVLLARGHEECLALDLDGDGRDELVTPWQLFFEREGAVYETRLEELVKEACPELTYWEYSLWDKYGKRLYVKGLSGEATWERYVYFDGESLLIYKNEKPTIDHMVEGADEGVPTPVVEAAREFVDGVYVTAEAEQLEAELREKAHQAGVGEAPEGELPPEFDDWRIDYFDGPYRYPYGGAVVEGWWFNYELHTATPEKVVLAGGKYITEDNWVSPGYPGCDALFFEVGSDGSYRLLSRGMFQEYQESDFVRHAVLGMMREEGVKLEPGYSYDLLDLAYDLDQILDHPGDGGVNLELAPLSGAGGWRATYSADPKEGYGPYLRASFSDPEQYRWTRLEAAPQIPVETCLTLAREDWSLILRFWEGSDLVMRKGDNEEPVWYRAEGSSQGSIFTLARGWFDEAEMRERAGVALKDHGEGPYETAMAYLTYAETAAKTLAAPGGRYTCAFAKIADLEWEYPDPEDRGRFRFSYSLIFLPENGEALNNLMAGNTGAYEGSDPEAPEGALQYWRTGEMYLEDGYWHCGGLYTG